MDQDEASSDVPLSIFKKEVNQIIDENSNSSDVPLSTLRAKKVMIDEDSNSSDAPLNILKKPTEKSHDTGKFLLSYIGVSSGFLKFVQFSPQKAEKSP